MHSAMGTRGIPCRGFASILFFSSRIVGSVFTHRCALGQRSDSFFGGPRASSVRGAGASGYS